MKIIVPGHTVSIKTTGVSVQSVCAQILSRHTKSAGLQKLETCLGLFEQSKILRGDKQKSSKDILSSLVARWKGDQSFLSALEQFPTCNAKSQFLDGFKEEYKLSREDFVHDTLSRFDSAQLIMFGTLGALLNNAFAAYQTTPNSDTKNALDTLCDTALSNAGFTAGGASMLSPDAAVYFSQHVATKFEGIQKAKIGVQ